MSRSTDDIQNSLIKELQKLWKKKQEDREEQILKSAEQKLKEQRRLTKLEQQTVEEQILIESKQRLREQKRLGDSEQKIKGEKLFSDNMQEKKKLQLSEQQNNSTPTYRINTKEIFSQEPFSTLFRAIKYFNSTSIINNSGFVVTQEKQETKYVTYASYLKQLEDSNNKNKDEVNEELSTKLKEALDSFYKFPPEQTNKTKPSDKKNTSTQINPYQHRLMALIIKNKLTFKYNYYGQIEYCKKLIKSIISFLKKEYSSYVSEMKTELFKTLKETLSKNHFSSHWKEMLQYHGFYESMGIHHFTMRLWNSSQTKCIPINLYFHTKKILKLLEELLMEQEPLPPLIIPPSPTITLSTSNSSPSFTPSFSSSSSSSSSTLQITPSSTSQSLIPSSPSNSPTHSNNVNFCSTTTTNITTSTTMISNNSPTPKLSHSSSNPSLLLLSKFFSTGNFSTSSSSSTTSTSSTNIFSTNTSTSSITSGSTTETLKKAQKRLIKYTLKGTLSR